MEYLVVHGISDIERDIGEMIASVRPHGSFAGRFARLPNHFGCAKGRPGRSIRYEAIIAALAAGEMAALRHVARRIGASRHRAIKGEWMGVEIACVAPTRSRVGEGAVWDDRAGCLWWVDIPAGIVYRYDPETGENRGVAFGEPVGCLAVREKGGLVVAAKSGFWFFDPESGARRAIADPEADLPDNRFNDGATDADGRFWAGTMKDGGDPEALGSFYRLDPDLAVTRWKSGFFTTNGLAFSPDGTRMYFSDSNPAVRSIWASDYDPATGTPGEPSLFFDTAVVAGRPDGGTVDSEGCYWQAGVSGWQLYRLSPTGEVLTTVDMPVEKPTKPMFGGRELDTLYVTSIGTGLAEGTHQPEAGGLFAVAGLGVTGVPQPRFAG